MLAQRYCQNPLDLVCDFDRLCAIVDISSKYADSLPKPLPEGAIDLAEKYK